MKTAGYVVVAGRAGLREAGTVHGATVNCLGQDI